MVKRLTGDEKLSARYMHKNFYELMRTFNVFLATNFRPVIKGKDRGIWRRVRLIPFLVTFVKPEEQTAPPYRLREDTTLKATLQAEASGILNWIIQGCLEWRKGGMRPPSAVLEATESYKTEMDSIASFIASRCDVKPGLRVRSSDLHATYKAHCEELGVKPDDILTQTSFGKDMKNRGYIGKHFKDGNYWLGIELKSKQPELFPEADEVKGSPG